MEHIAVIRSVWNGKSYYFSEINQMKHYEPYVYCRKQKNINSFPYKNVETFQNQKKLEKMLQHRPFKLLHAQQALAGVDLLSLKQKSNIPLVISFDGFESPDKIKNKYNELLHLFSIGDFFTVPCQAVKLELIKNGCPSEKIAVLYRGIDPLRFPYKERSFPTEGAVKIVYSGRLIKQNGAHLLIRAFHQVHQVFPHAHLSIIGDGTMKESLKQLSKELDLAKFIDFKGPLKQQEIVKQLDESHIFCHPRIKDQRNNHYSIPSSLKEAMACGLPVVSTFHPAIPELIENNKSGHLVVDNDVDAIANKLIELINHPETWQTISKAARSKIETDFNLHIQAEKLEKIYSRVIRTHSQSQSQQPFFSVIIPTYNREKFIRRAINSVLDQTCKDYEIIVVDDGSNDQTRKIVREYRTKVRYVYQEQQGPSIARNTGIKLAKGKYIAFLDSDDQFLPNKLEINKKFLEANPSAFFLYSWYYEINNEKQKKLINDLVQYQSLYSFRKNLYKRKFTIRTSTAVVHKSCFDKVGLFNSKYRYSQDWDMWLRLSSAYNGYCQKYPLAIYRRHPRPKLATGNHHSEIRHNAEKLFVSEGVKKR